MPRRKSVHSCSYGGEASAQYRAPRAGRWAAERPPAAARCVRSRPWQQKQQASTPATGSVLNGTRGGNAAARRRPPRGGAAPPRPRSRRARAIPAAAGQTAGVDAYSGERLHSRQRGRRGRPPRGAPSGAGVAATPPQPPGARDPGGSVSNRCQRHIGRRGREGGASTAAAKGEGAAHGGGGPGSTTASTAADSGARTGAIRVGVTTVGGRYTCRNLTVRSIWLGPGPACDGDVWGMRPIRSSMPVSVSDHVWAAVARLAGRGLMSEGLLSVQAASILASDWWI